MKILVVTHDFMRYFNGIRKEVNEKYSEDIGVCFVALDFKNIVKEEKPDLIFSDGTAKEEYDDGETRICSFDAKKEVQELNMTIPVYPLSGWEFWLKEIIKKEKRKNEIAYQLLLLKTRENGSFNFLSSAKREIGNNIDKKELKDISKEELKEFEKNLYKKAFQNVIEDL